MTQVRDRHPSSSNVDRVPGTWQSSSTYTQRVLVRGSTSIYCCGINFWSALTSKELGFVERIALKTIPSATPPTSQHGTSRCVVWPRARGYHNTTHVLTVCNSPHLLRVFLLYRGVSWQRVRTKVFSVIRGRPQASQNPNPSLRAARAGRCFLVFGDSPCRLTYSHDRRCSSRALMPTEKNHRRTRERTECPRGTSWSCWVGEVERVLWYGTRSVRPPECRASTLAC